MQRTKKRKVTYVINDNEWFRRDMMSHNPELTVEQIEEILDNMNPPLIAEYSLIGDSQPDRYELSINGEKASINDKRLNNYHKGCILNDCYRHFMGHERGALDLLRGYPKENVFGCIDIIETEVDE